ncbi:MAG: tetratricopeptide repeat protein [Bacteroidia bacterium]|nr:tetratricopeptide repeat protein [Bacteroidia bacterium]
MRPLYRFALPVIALGCIALASCGSPTKTDDDIPVTTASEEARSAFIDGRQAWEAGRVEQARDAFDTAIAADPAFALAYLYRARSASSAVEWKAFVDKALANKATASEGEKILIDLTATRLDDDVQGALVLAEKLVHAFPTSARAQHELADAYADMRKTTEARTALLKATELDGKWGRAFGSLAMSYVFDAPRDLAKAEEYAKQYTTLDPQEPNAQIILGDVFRAQVELEKARDAYAKAAELDASSSVALSKKGHVETFLGNYDAARADFESAAQKTSRWQAGPKNMATFTWLYAGDAKAALAANEAVIAALPTLISDTDQLDQAMLNTYANRCYIAADTRAFDIAEQAYAKHAEIARTIAAALQNPMFVKYTESNLALLEGHMLARKGELAAAAALADKAERELQGTNDPRAMNGVHFLRGLVAHLSGKQQDAIGHFTPISNEMIEARYYAALAHEALGEKEQALKLYKEVVDWNFNDIQYALVRSKAVAKLKS